jgi:hypothetical protein
MRCKNRQRMQEKETMSYQMMRSAILDKNLALLSKLLSNPYHPQK